MAYGHGGRREGAGRPQGASSHRNLLFGTLAAGLARKYDAEAVNTLASIMEDERAPSRTRLEAVREILDRGHGRPTPSNEPLEEQALPSASPPLKAENVRGRVTRQQCRQRPGEGSRPRSKGLCRRKGYTEFPHPLKGGKFVTASVRT
jgi:hypothetical protein